MDYEKKYNEALERAKELIAKWTGKNKDFYVEDYSYIFPELRESEDERIRKAIIKSIEEDSEEDSSVYEQDVSKEQMLSWLEKQKEPHKRLRDKTPWIVTAKEELAHDEECLQAKQLEELRRIRAEKEKQKEQKPAWSEEDEKIMQTMIKEGDLKPSEIAWLKSLRPQPNWKPSKDEERLINTSISFLKDFADKGYENAVECIDWLKSKLNGNSGK